VRRLSKRILLIILVVALVIALRPSLLNSTKCFLFELINLPLRLMGGIGRSFKLKSSYMKENLLLKEKAALLALELGKTSSLREENRRLRELLDFKEKFTHRSLPAQVIGRSPVAWTHTILINKGRTHGVVKKMAVCTGSGLAGTVVEAGPVTSKVMLITDSNSRIGAILEGSRQSGVLIGSQEGVCKVIYLGMDSRVDKNEKVFTSGFGGIFPKDILIGTVDKVGIDQSELYKYAVIKPGQDLNALEEVICIE